MAEEIILKPFTIKDADVNDINKFNEQKSKKRLTAGGFFSELLNGVNQQVNNNNTNNDIDQVKSLQEANKALTLEIEELKNQTPATTTIEVEKKLSGTQFILEPTEAQAKNMRRAITYLIKNGVLSRADKNLPAQFVTKAINYYLKNEFNHILK